MLVDAHRTFGIPSPLRLSLDDDRIYFYNFGEKSRILQGARLSYEVLWGFYLAAYELVLKNQQQRRNEARALEDPDEDGLDEESLRRTAALNVWEKMKSCSWPLTLCWTMRSRSCSIRRGMQ